MIDELKKQIEELPEEQKTKVEIYFQAHSLAVNVFNMLDPSSAELVMKYISAVMSD